MDTDQLALKKLAKISLAAIGVLFVLGVVFYKERVLFADASFILFNIINNNDFAIQVGRYGSFISQLFPYVGQKMHLPIDTLIFLYGMSFNLFYLTVASLLVFWLKQYRLVILMALFYFLFISQSYIWTCELFQGIAWMFLLFGITIHLGNKKVNIFLLLVPFIILAVLSIFTHFTIIIPTVFLWGFFIIDKKNWPFSRNKTILLSCILAAVFAAKYYIAVYHTESKYDADLVQGAVHFSIKDTIHSFQTPVIKIFLHRCITNYWIGTAFFIMGIISLIKKEKRILAAWALLACVGYFIIMGLTYGKYDDKFLLFHVESEWACFGILSSAPFVFSFLPGSRPVIATWLLVGAFLIRLGYIGVTIPAFSKRNVIKEQILSQMRKKGITKLVLYNDNELRSACILDWALPYESVLMSCVDHDVPQLSFIFVNPDNKELINALSSPQGMATPWGILDSKNINHKYFTIDTTHPYQVMTYEELLK